jgi:polo-like kinase 1
VRLRRCLDQGHCLCRAFGWQSGSTIAKSTLHHALPRALIPTPFVRYGLGYELSDGTNGVFFNDATKMVADSCAGGVCGTPLIEYVERVRLPSGGKQDVRRRYKEDRYPSDLKKKVTLLQHFKSFLQENEQAQVSACNDGSVPRRASDGDTVYVRKWMLTRHAIIFRLSNNNLQVNFFDQTEIFLWAEQPRFVTYVSKARQRATYDIGEAAGVPELAKRVKYVRDILAQLIGKA